MSSRSKLDTLSDPRLFLSAYLRSEGLEFKTKGRFDGSNKFKFNSSIFTTMWLDYIQQLRAYKALAPRNEGVKGFSKDELQLAFSEFVEQNDLRLLKHKLSEIKCENEDLSLLRMFVSATMGTEDPLTIAVLAHWIYNIKNKMFGKPVGNHIMPVFYGRDQGTGKSTAVGKLTSPIDDWKEDLKIDEICDPRYGYVFQENFVLFFDEMQNADRSEISTLKNKITGKSFGCRKLGTNIVDRVQQNSAFIGTSNKPIDEQIIDSSGMRRFFQVDVAEKGGWRWDLINSIDYNLLFKGIDENRVELYIEPFRTQLQAKQNEMIATDFVDDFISEFKMSSPGGNGKAVPAGLVYRNFKIWCEKNGFKPLNSSWLGRRLKNRGVKEDRTADARRYIVSEESFSQFQNYACGRLLEI